MTTRQKIEKKHANPSRAMAMGFVGFGLLILGALTLVLLTRSSAASSKEDATNYPSAVPQPVEFQAPELTLTDINGITSSLSDFAGKIVLVNNWAIWCPPCRAELPELQAYYDAHKDENFTIIGIEAGSEKEDVVYHANLFKLKYPVWLDPGQTAVTAFRNGSLPNSYVLDGHGVVRFAWTGPINRQALEKYITPLFEGQ
jgi:thiol-disulfide isomerase/thioredoxin